MVILYNKLLELSKEGMQMNENKTSCAPADNRLTLWDRID